MVSTGTVIAICYVKEGFVLATDSIAYVKGHPPLTVQKLFTPSHRLGCALTGLAHFENDETGETSSLLDVIRDTASSLKTDDADVVLERLARAYRQGILDAQTRLGAKLRGQKAKFAELVLAGFNKDSPILARVLFRRKGESLKEPRIKFRVLSEPILYFYSGIGSLPANSLDEHQDNPAISAVLKYNANRPNPPGIPPDFSMNQAIELVRTYVEIAIGVGDPKVGGKPQIAKIPRDGTFSFVIPPEVNGLVS